MRRASPHARLMRPRRARGGQLLPPASSKTARGRAFLVARLRGRRGRSEYASICEAASGERRRIPRASGRPPTALFESRGDLRPDPADELRQLGRPRRGFTQPERDRGRLAARVGDPHAAGLDLEDLTTRSRLEDVAVIDSIAKSSLIEPITVPRDPGRPVIRHVRDRAARRHGRDPRPAPSADDTLTASKGCTRRPPRRVAYPSASMWTTPEVLAREVAIRHAPDEPEEIVERPVAARRCGHDLLGEMSSAAGITRRSSRSSRDARRSAAHSRARRATARTGARARPSP